VRTVISTGDKDMTQLVNPARDTRQHHVERDAGCRGSRKKFGVKPERIVDYLALIGDAVDNVPGVDKVGPKTALKWLAYMKRLDNLIVRRRNRRDNRRKPEAAARLAAAGTRTVDDQMRRRVAG
jgi:5'-3' exonuclease